MTTIEVEREGIKQAIFGGATIDIPVPEKWQTIEAQMKWLKEGKRKAVYLPNGSYIPKDINGFNFLRLKKGDFIYNPNKISEEEIIDLVNKNKIGDILGFGISEKPPLLKIVGAIVIRDINGIEKQAVAVDSLHFTKVYNKSIELADIGDAISFETTEKVIMERMN